MKNIHQGLKTAKAKLGKLKKKLQKDEAELEITKGQIEEITEELETMVLLEI